MELRVERSSDTATSCCTSCPAPLSLLSHGTVGQEDLISDPPCAGPAAPGSYPRGGQAAPPNAMAGRGIRIIDQSLVSHLHFNAYSGWHVR